MDRPMRRRVAHIPSEACWQAFYTVSHNHSEKTAWTDLNRHGDLQSANRPLAEVQARQMDLPIYNHRWKV